MNKCMNKKSTTQCGKRHLVPNSLCLFRMCSASAASAAKCTVHQSQASALPYAFPSSTAKMAGGGPDRPPINDAPFTNSFRGPDEDDVEAQHSDDLEVDRSDDSADVNVEGGMTVAFKVGTLCDQPLKSDTHQLAILQRAVPSSCLGNR